MKDPFVSALVSIFQRFSLWSAPVAIVAIVGTSVVYATPDISNVSAPTLIEGQQITISGTGFGSGPHVLLYDNFNGGTPGAIIPLKATVGSWTSTGNNLPKYSAYGLGGTTADQIRVDSTMRQFRLLFPENERELFLSYWVATPPGTKFPSATAPDELSSVSSWKMAWAMYGSSGYTSHNGYGPANDVCLPTWAGGAWLIGGNDSTLTYLPHTPWFGFERYTRVSIWLKANPTDPTLPGKIAFQALQEGQGIMLSYTRSDRPIFDKDSPPKLPNDPKAWDRINVPGWVKGGNPVYDDVYIAAGPNAQARVEIGNAPTYAASTNLALLTPVAWGPTQIIATLRKGPFTSFSNLYVYVVDANGNVNGKGIPLGSTTSSTFSSGNTLGSGSSTFTGFSTTTSTTTDPRGSNTSSSPSSGTVGGTPVPSTESANLAGASAAKGGGVGSSTSGSNGLGSASRSRTSIGSAFMSTSSGGGGYGANTLGSPGSMVSATTSSRTSGGQGMATSAGRGGTSNSYSLAFPKRPSQQANEAANGSAATATGTSSGGIGAYIKSPQDGSIVSNTTTLTAYATPGAGRGVALVKILVDGSLQCAGAPRASCSWNTQTVPNGQHIITVSVNDSAGQTSKTQISVTVAN